MSEDKKIDSALLKESNTLMIRVLVAAVVAIVIPYFVKSNIQLAIASLVLLFAIFQAIFQDYKMWTEKGIKMCSKWWAFLYPVYLWKRCKILGIKKTLFFVWVGIFILSIVVAVMFPPKPSLASIEKTACQLTTQIVEKQLNLPIAMCTKAKLTPSKVKDNVYNGTATVLLGQKTETINIQATLQKNGMVYVEITE